MLQESIISPNVKQDKRIHIVCFDIPYPPTYGGAIDVYYRIKALHDVGYRITLHCTHKSKLTKFPELEALCYKVCYYPRRMRLSGLMSTKPLSVHSRPNRDILRHLLEDDAPILYEGLVSCGTMDAPELRNRRKYFRECNVEHDYYRALGKASEQLWKKLFYFLEAKRLERFEAILHQATAIFALAHQDEQHFIKQYPEVPTYFVPCFHANEQCTSSTGLGKGILYHGNMNVAENALVAKRIMQNIAPKMPDIPFTIAGRCGDTKLQAMANQCANVCLIANPSDKKMNQLISEAQVHLLLTFQNTGLKLKLLNTLYQGRHIVANQEMVGGSDMEALCHVGNTIDEWIALCKQCYTQPFTEQDIATRQQQLMTLDNALLTKRLVQTIEAQHTK